MPPELDSSAWRLAPPLPLAPRSPFVWRSTRAACALAACSAAPLDGLRDGPEDGALREPEDAPEKPAPAIAAAPPPSPLDKCRRSSVPRCVSARSSRLTWSAHALWPQRMVAELVEERDHRVFAARSRAAAKAKVRAVPLSLISFQLGMCRHGKLT